MGSGGARNRSGPRPDPNSAKSERKGLVFTALPAEGYRGAIPAFPLPQATARETAVWRAAWRSPQACAWALQPWRHYLIGQWVRWSVRAEAQDATAAMVTAAIRYADQIGMTPAGLKENGWQIAEDETAKRRGQVDEQLDEGEDPRDRFTVVTDADGG